MNYIISLIVKINADQTRIFDTIKYHLQHPVQHESGACNCNCSDLKPHALHQWCGRNGKNVSLKDDPYFTTDRRMEDLKCWLHVST